PSRHLRSAPGAWSWSAPILRFRRRLETGRIARKCRKIECKNGPTLAVVSGVDEDRASMCLDGPLHQRQPEAGPAFPAGEERVEDLLLQLVRHTGSGI